MSSLTRAQLLRGGWGANKRDIIRPPWAKAAQLFTDLCSRCGACIEVCPEKIITTGSGKFPVLDFAKGGCSFCQKCVEVCQEDVFIGLDNPPWRLTASIQDNCLSKIGVVCQSCADICERKAILFSLQMGGIPAVELNPQNCNGCGDCVAICPTESIQISAN
jgi:ferredoxin-type protein NapF